MMRTSPLSGSFSKGENDETVWHTRKQRQQKESEIQLMLNRLKLLKRNDEQLQQRIVETKKKTQSMSNLKLNHHQMIEQKKLSKKNDEELLRMRQKENLSHKQEQQEQLEAIKDAVRKIKQEEHAVIKQMSEKNTQIIEQMREDYIRFNKSKRELTKQYMNQSKSNIQKFWDNKLESIKDDNKKVKLLNKRVCEESQAYFDKLTMEESYLIQKLKKSQEVQHKLALKLEEVKNKPHNEQPAFLDDLEVTEHKKQKSSEPPGWLPTPEKEAQSQKLETDPQDTSKKGSKKPDPKSQGDDDGNKEGES